MLYHNRTDYYLSNDNFLKRIKVILEKHFFKLFRIKFTKTFRITSFSFSFTFKI